MNNTMHESNIALWHRTVCQVNDWLYISGDLPFKLQPAKAKLQEWVDAGITDIFDAREEWSDENLVAEHAQHVRYHYFGTHDNGLGQSFEWFKAAILDVRKTRKAHPDAVIMSHCHMGINRGPSLAFAMLLDDGYGVVKALNAIRNVRPIAGIIYATDAIKAIGKMKSWSQSDIAYKVAIANEWFDSNEISISNIIKRIREAEIVEDFAQAEEPTSNEQVILGTLKEGQ